MYFEQNNYRDAQSMHDHCKRCMNYHVIVMMKDGSTFDGIVDSVDMDRVCILVGEDVMDQEGEMQCDDQRQFMGFGFPRRRFRRFRRRLFPLASLAAISLLPFPIFAPQPFFPW